MDNPQTTRGDSASSWRRGLDAVRRGWWVVVIMALAGGIAGTFGSELQQSMYSSTAVLYVTSPTEGSTQSAYQGNLASQERVASYARLATSDTVLTHAIDKSGIGLSVSEARRELKTEVTPSTVLLSITATSPSAEQAATLVNAVAGSLSAYVSDIERPQSGGEPLARVTVVTPGQAVATRVSPHVVRNSMLGVLVGICLGVCFVVIRSRFDTTVRSGEDLRDVSEFPILGAVPSSGELSNGSNAEFSIGGGRVAESYRKLRANLGFSSVDDPPRVVMVTSATAGEGKSTTAANLAIALAESGCRTVLLDADFRRPTLVARFGLSGSIGFTDYLRGKASMRDLVQDTEVPRLSFVACGAIPPNPTELLNSERARLGIGELRELFEYVIIDSAPILAVSDSIFLIRSVDGILGVVRCGHVTTPSVKSFLNEVKSVNGVVCGIVLNDVDVSSGAAGYGYGYGYEADPEAAASASGVASG